MILPSEGYLRGALLTHEHNGEEDRAAKVRAQIEAYAHLRPLDRERKQAENAAQILRSAAKLCPDLADDLFARANALTARAKELRAFLGSECAKIEARRLP